MQCITHPRTPHQSYNSAGSAPIGAPYSVESDCLSFKAVVVAPVVYSTLFANVLKPQVFHLGKI